MVVPVRQVKRMGVHGVRSFERGRNPWHDATRARTERRYTARVPGHTGSAGAPGIRFADARRWFRPHPGSFEQITRAREGPC